MSNIIACLGFNLVGLGTSYFLSLFERGNRSPILPGTSVFFGFLASMLLAYSLWLCMPNRLDLAVYLTSGIALVGVVLLIKEQGIQSLIRSNYFIAFVCLLLVSGFFDYTPYLWDEFTHWLATPKLFYYENTLCPVGGLFGAFLYTPLWTLQAAFFQFFSPSGFSPAIVYMLRLCVTISFLFFIKETTKLRWVTFFVGLCVLTAITMILLQLSKKGLLPFYYPYGMTCLFIEYPIFILVLSLLFLIDGLKKENAQRTLTFFIVTLLAAYMVKKACIALIPAGFIVLWINNYKKQAFCLIGLLAFFYISWNLKTSPPPMAYLMVSNLWSPRAIIVYKEVLRQFIDVKGLFILLFISLYVMYRKNKNVFVFYSVFSAIYFIGLVVSYSLWCFSDSEAATLASYVRYLSTLLEPATVFVYFIILEGIQNTFSTKIDVLEMRVRFKCILPLLVAILVIIPFYEKTRGIKEDPIITKYNDIKKLYDVKNKNLLIIAQGETCYPPFYLQYASCGDFSPVDARSSFGPTEDNAWRTPITVSDFLTLLKTKDVIIIIKSDAWLNNAIAPLTLQRRDDLTNQVLVKRGDHYEFLHEAPFVGEKPKQKRKKCPLCGHEIKKHKKKKVNFYQKWIKPMFD